MNGQNNKGRPAVNRTREEIMEADTFVSGLENEPGIETEYAVYTNDVFRWLRGDDNSMLGRKLKAAKDAHATKCKSIALNYIRNAIVFLEATANPACDVPANMQALRDSMNRAVSSLRAVDVNHDALGPLLSAVRFLEDCPPNTMRLVHNLLRETLLILEPAGVAV